MQKMRSCSKDAKLLPDDNIFSEDSLYYMVHNEINYLKPAFFDNELNIYTRISYIKHSSFGFEHIVENSRSTVHVNPVKRKSAIIPDDIIEKVKLFEPSVKILRP